MVTIEEKTTIVSSLVARIKDTQEPKEMKACAAAVRILLRETDGCSDALTEEVQISFVKTDLLVLLESVGCLWLQ